MNRLAGSLTFLALFTVGFTMLLSALVVSVKYDEPSLFAGGLESSIDVYGPSRLLLFSLFIGFVASVVLAWISSRRYMYCAAIIFVVWLFLGRTVGVHYSGFVYIGWFYWRTERIELVPQDGKFDSSRVENPFKLSRIERIGPLCIKVVGAHDSTVFFVDPLTASQFLNRIDSLRDYD